MPTTVISVRGKDREVLLRDPMFCYVGRRCAGWPASPWGNPWKSGQAHGGGKLSTYGAVNLYRRAIACDPDEPWRKLRLLLPELRGKRLGCWCGEWTPGDPPLQCHARILAELADGPMGEPR